MNFVPILAHIAAIHLVMAMVPGPNTVVVSYCSASLSREAGIKAALGIVAASCIWVLLSLAGVSVLLMQAGTLFTFIRMAGAAYLLYVGIKLLRSSATSKGATSPKAYRSPFVAGFLTTLSNPKSAIFWSSVFTLVLPDHAPAWFYVAILVLIAAQASLWYGFVAFALSTSLSRRYYERLATVLNRIAGGCMLFFGLKIANELRLEIAKRLV